MISRSRHRIAAGLVFLLLLGASHGVDAGPQEEPTADWQTMEATGDRLIEEAASYVSYRFWNAAEQMYLGALALAESEQAPEEDRAELLLKLGQVSQRFGRYDEAAGRYERALALAEAAFGPESPDLSPYLEKLGNVDYLREDLASGRAAFERCLAIQERAFGPRSLEAAGTLQLLGAALRQEGDPEAGLELHRRALSIRRELLPVDDERVSEARASVIQTLKELGRWEEAERFRTSSLPDAEAAS